MEKQLERLLETFEDLADEADGMHFLAGAVCELLRGEFENYSWVGIYMVEGDELVLETYAGEQDTEHQRIPVGQGICGLAAREKRTINVKDVQEDSRYLSCFLSTRSELVVPIMHQGEVFGEIDIDSDTLGAFSRQDERIVEALAHRLAEWVAKNGRE